MAKHNEIGKLGEKIATEFLERKGFTIIDTNYNKKWGEIDIVALAPHKNIVTRERRLVHFIEVKSKSSNIVDLDKKLSYENKKGSKIATDSVSYETKDEFRPEEMLHSRKIQRLRRVVQTYILEKSVENWQFDVIIVYIDKNQRIARCKYLRDIVL